MKLHIARHGHAACLIRSLQKTVSMLTLLFGLGVSGGAYAQGSDDLRMYFEQLNAGGPAMVSGQTLKFSPALQRLYLATDFQPLWTERGPLATQLDQLVAAIERSAGHGFNTSVYHLPFLKATTRDRGNTLAIELLASDAFFAQAHHRSSGVVDPELIDPDWHIKPMPQDQVQRLLMLRSAPADVGAMLDTLWPQHEEYQTLVAARAAILATGVTHSTSIEAGKALKRGMSGPRVAQVQSRLLGPGQYADVFDDTLEDSVRSFQSAAGLDADGIVGEATLEVLNADSVAWVERLDANLERWRWLPHVLPETLVRVNIAAFQLRVIDRNTELFAMDVIVGRPFRKTPIFTQTMKYMVLNPYWNVPFKLATQDKLPVLKTNPQKLLDLGYEAKRADQPNFVPVTEIDWSTVSARNFNYALRQKPGPQNALGLIKFMLPNDHAVYLHDTNERLLFSKKERGFSSGCIRLAEPLKLAHWILENDGRTSEAALLEQQIELGETKSVNLSQPLPVYIVYFTAYTDAQGDVVFRRDLYQRDAPIVRMLRGT